ncbi:MAG TPA: hypothetical protein VFT61_05670, partial [Sphingomicrobium sp.]|nr:hypothetical protein [Sphingomicrobium sp.]
MKKTKPARWNLIQWLLGGGAGNGGGTGNGGGAASGTELAVAPNPDGEALLHVFRTVADPFVGQVSTFKVL